MEIIFLLVGLLFVAIGAALVVSEARTRIGAMEVPAELVGFSTGKSASGASFHAVARYAGLDGQTCYLESSIGSSTPLGCVGDRLSVFVQPSDPAKAEVKSPLTYVLGAVLAAMGLVCCVVFFAIFRITAFSIAGAVAVVGWGAWKLHGALRGMPMSAQAWREYKSRAIGPRIFTDASKGEIAWANPEAVESAFLRQQKSNRFAVPLLVLAGAGLVALGGHLYKKTEIFLASAVRETGVVVELVANRSSDGTTWAPVVEFEHEGRQYKFKDSVSSNPASHRIGDHVDVLCDPSHPSDARIDRGAWNKGIPLLVALAGALSFLLGLRLAFRRPRPPLAAALPGT